jgi:putative membrane protein
MIGFTIRILGNILAIYVAYRLIPGVIINGGLREFILGGALLGLLNMTVRPFLRFVSMPLIILSLGIFALVINAALIWLVDFVFDFVRIQSLWSLFWATIIITIINVIVSLISKSFD